jgi:ParB family chromosome partitioning protein
MDLLKIINAPLEAVDVKDIASDQGACCMSFGFDLKPLIRSIERIGLINAPVVMKERQGRAEIISGYRRILALKLLGWDRIPCRIPSISPLEGLLVNLYENLSTRDFNLVEKGMVLSRLTAWRPTTEILLRYMPLLSLPSHEPILTFFVRLETELDRQTKDRLIQGGLSLQGARMLLDVEPRSRFPLLDLITTLRLNVNQQKKLMEYLMDISRRDKVSVSQILQDPKMTEIRTDAALNTPQKARAVLDFWRANRFPILVNAEKSFKRNISTLGLPDGVKITPPPFFESASYQLKAVFTNGKDLKDKIEALSRMKGLEGLKDPWEAGT